MSAQIPVRQDPQTQLAFQQMQQQIAALNKKVAALTKTSTISSSSSSGGSATTPTVPITESFTYTTGVFLYSAVYESAAGQVSLADPGTDDTADPIGIVTGLGGSQAKVTTFGDVTNAAWSWMPGLPVYLWPGGMLSQGVPDAGRIVILGFAASTTRIRLWSGAELAQNSAAGGLYNIAAGITQIIPDGQISFTFGPLYNSGTLVNNGRLVSL